MGAIAETRAQIDKLTSRNPYSGAILTSIMSIAAIAISGRAMDANGYQWYSWW